MRLFVCTPVRPAIALLMATLSLSACSGSSDSGSAADPDVENEDTQSDPVTPSGGEDNPAVPDPLVQNQVTAEFDITVPAHVSDALQVGVVWGEQAISAQWVGDEMWFASAELPANTQNSLVITFYDDNGGIVLGSVERALRTGVNDLEVHVFTADQFDTDKWDDDSDGASNLDELIVGTDPSGSPRVLLFSETRDYRHPSIEDALTALEDLASSAAIQTDRAGDSADVFTESALADYDAVVWVMTSGDVLDAAEQAAFESYIRAGGGYAGIHAASDTEYDWPWYGSLVGAYFDRHPVVQSATQIVEDGSHASTTHLGASWTRTDEWYDYRSNPRAQVSVLLRLDESSYSGGEMGDDHPSAWYHNHDGGRAWYTGGGHTSESYAEADFRAHLLGGLRYAAGLVD